MRPRVEPLQVILLQHVSREQLDAAKRLFMRHVLLLVHALASGTSFSLNSLRDVHHDFLDIFFSHCISRLGLLYSREPLLTNNFIIEQVDDCSTRAAGDHIHNNKKNTHKNKNKNKGKNKDNNKNRKKKKKKKNNNNNLVSGYCLQLGSWCQLASELNKLYSS